MKSDLFMIFFWLGSLIFGIWGIFNYFYKGVILCILSIILIFYFTLNLKQKLTEGDE